MNTDKIKLIDKLNSGEKLSADEYSYLISSHDTFVSEYLFEKAREKKEKYYGKDIYIRGLIEFSNYCKNDCFYCGIQKSNPNAKRYRLNRSDILECCKEGYSLGFRTFVLQSGEDLSYTDDMICDIISNIKAVYPDCAVTLSIGEKSFESYQAYFNAGADRYLLRHETANAEHYAKLHPKELNFENRIRCLYDLKKIGFQVGAGFMVGSPFQTPQMLAEDMIFLRDFQPHMVGIGPFIPHHDTKFSKFKPGTLELTLFMLALIRLTLPNILIPATTALGTIDIHGREKGILAGANVIMPNLSPVNVRKKYLLYDNKITTGDESAQSVMLLRSHIENIGSKIVTSKGDCKKI